MRSRTLVVLFALVGVVAVTGASAFTTATVARDAQIDVAADQNGIIGIEAGNAPAATTNGNELVLDADQENLNVNASFVYGDDAGPGASDSANANDAVRVTNNDNQAHDFKFNLTASGPGTLTLYLQKGTGTVETLSSGGSTTLTVNSGETVYVAAKITTGSSTGTIDGTFTVEAT